jgi:phosphopantothenoylcysteine decarboxylase/phosphopantothenate--cysteine ligase
MAKANAGLANDLASTMLLATDKPVLMVPAMNVRMWQHAATIRNVAQLRADGVTVLEPDEGAMACGEFGPGRLPEIAAIVAEIESRLEEPVQGGLTGFHALVTAGPTREPLDPVRYLSNHSSGRQGYAIAAALAGQGANVTLVSGPVSLAAPRSVTLVKVETARQMLKACEEALPADVFISVAAVADWRPARAATKKLKIKGAGSEAPSMELTENPDILKTLSNKRKNRPRLVIGFAAETHDLEDYARAKLDRKGCDWIVANDVSGDVMGGAENEVVLISRADAERWPRMGKDDVARRLVRKIVAEFGHDDGGVRLAAE